MVDIKPQKPGSNTVAAPAPAAQPVDQTPKTQVIPAAKKGPKPAKRASDAQPKKDTVKPVVDAMSKRLAAQESEILSLRNDLESLSSTVQVKGQATTRDDIPRSDIASLINSVRKSHTNHYPKCPSCGSKGPYVPEVKGEKIELKCACGNVVLWDPTPGWVVTMNVEKWLKEV
jgi:hypothetical protein